MGTVSLSKMAANWPLFFAALLNVLFARSDDMSRQIESCLTSPPYFRGGELVGSLAAD